MNRMNRKHWVVGVALLAGLVLGFALVRTPVQAQSGKSEVTTMMQQIGLLRELLGLIGDVSEITKNESSTGVLAVMSIEEHFQDRNDAIKFLTRMLSEAENDIVRRSIRIQLADFYKNNNQPTKAVEQLEQLIKGEE